jgi:hypothetical protein
MVINIYGDLHIGQFIIHEEIPGTSLEGDRIYFANPIYPEEVVRLCRLKVSGD